ncbi:expressed unknown protein [Seminavis robusta]|uniref:TIR domain-containing protein n=1 Tax=Seminavis robusta TaxID=568900 RepID=A0A9N8EN88_9STRA|nr:expressed unknown protein [Seminavis robusta]|eukprot:Sro1375_g267410.1 n/a (334) ;mRNA; f:25030-26031
MSSSMDDNIGDNVGKNQIFISHDSRDRELVHVIAETLKRVSQESVRVWFSSDESTPTGGMSPGSIWLDEIRLQILKSKLMIVVLTPLSLDRPWLSFETGYASATEGCNVVPVCVGIDKKDISFPLAMYQCYQLVDYESLKRFVALILAQYDIPFDEEVVKPILREAIPKLIQAMAPPYGMETDQEEPTELAQVKEHIDLQFADLKGRISALNKKSDSGELMIPLNSFSYSVEFQIDFPLLKRTVYLEMDPDTTVQTVLDNAYGMLANHLKPWTYLTCWIIQSRTSGRNLVIREIADMVPAQVVFTDGSKWKIMPLKRPWNGADARSSLFYGVE